MIKIWEFENYEVYEKSIYYGLHQFDIVVNGNIIETITPRDPEEQIEIIQDLHNNEIFYRLIY